eukprot:2485852-Amphidinium_carterae.1
MSLLGKLARSGPCDVDRNWHEPLSTLHGTKWDLPTASAHDTWKHSTSVKPVNATMAPVPEDQARKPDQSFSGPTPGNSHDRRHSKDTNRSIHIVDVQHEEPRLARLNCYFPP